MNKRKAYQILGLTADASEQEIRRRYKKLAMKVHPDLNPDENAHEEFIRLSLAVECLLRSEEGPVKPRQGRSASKKEETPEEKSSRMSEAKLRYEEQKRKNAEENIRYFESLTSGKRWVFFRCVMWIGVIISISLVLDLFLPHHLENDRMVSYSSANHNGIIRDRICMVNFENSGSSFVEVNNGTWNIGYPEVVVERTWLLHSPLYFYSSDDFRNFKTGFDFDLRSIQWLIIILLLIPLYPFFRRRLSIQFAFFYQFSFWAVGLLEVFILVGQNRLEHLLSLGFF